MDSIKRETRSLELFTEAKTLTLSNSMPRNRWTVIDWLRDIMCDGLCQRQTFYSAIQFFDYCLSKFNLSDCSWQIIGAACFSLASKYHV